MIELIVLALSAVGAIANGGKRKSLEWDTHKSPTFNQAWRLRQEEDAKEILAWRALWEPQIDRTKWIPAGTAKRIFSEYPHPVPPDNLERLLRKNIKLEKLKAEFDKANQVFLTSQKERLKDFFDTIEKQPLTDEQITACVCMDEHVQIVAAAGSGKTSTMVAKAGYLLKEKIATGEEILLVAFNNDAATELKHRIQSRLGHFDTADRITVKTFHAFGLEVIGNATHRKPSLAPWLERAGTETQMVVQIVNVLCQTNPAFNEAWNLFRTVYGRDTANTGSDVETDTFSDGKPGFETANGELVKSKQERLIANWLFYHNVAYEYERDYEHDTTNSHYRQYKPDFFYPDIQVYHEHFALNADGKPPAHLGYSYAAGVEWKRQEHRTRGTKLIETTSHQIASGVGLTHLKSTLEKFGLKPNFDPDRQASGSKPMTTQELAGIFRTFQKHVKNNGMSIFALRDALRDHIKEPDVDRFKRFVDLYEFIAAEWEACLAKAKCIDFEDMLNLAAGHVEQGRYSSPFTVILADEFQDSSRARVRLLKALTGKTDRPVHLSVVGDDWQGINRYAGADIRVMTAFNKIFPDAIRLTLSITFRCPQALCDAASAFVQANPSQMRKEVSSCNYYTQKQYLFAYGFNKRDDANAYLEDQLRQMRDYRKRRKLTAGANGRISVLLLGRYRKDVPGDLTHWQRKFGDCLDIAFKTVHSSKGLEADYVMILNMIDGVQGFPSQIEDDPVLQLPMPAPDSFPLADERRLFYVALTRARRQVRIFTLISNPSRFLKELEIAGTLVIETIDGSQIIRPKILPAARIPKSGHR